MRRVNSSTTHLDGYKKIPLKVSIISTELVRNEGLFNRNFIQYIIKISSTYKTWKVQKRYSDFEDFNKKISKKFHRLPPFPPKRFFRFSNATISERRAKFERYLNFLVKKVNICKFPELIDFLNIEPEIVEIFIKNNNMISSSLNYSLLNTSTSRKSSIGGRLNLSSGDLNTSSHQILNNSFSIYQENNYFAAYAEYKMSQEEEENNNNTILLNQNNNKSVGMCVIEEFLRNLQDQKQHKSEIVKTFMGYLKDKGKWRAFKKEEIIKLYTGECSQQEINQLNTQYIIIHNNSINSLSTEETKNSNLSITNNRPLKGLLFHIGDYKTNSFGSIACLNFLCKLTNYEFNPECDLYINLLKTRQIEYISEMKIGEFLKLNKRNCSEMGYKIIKLLINDDKSIQRVMKKIGCDDESIIKFKQMYEEEKIKLSAK